MKTIMIALLLAGCCAAAAAQAVPAAPAGKEEAQAAAQKKAPKAKAQPAAKPDEAAPKQAPVKKAAKPAPAPAAEQEPEESVVMIDSKAEPEETGRFSAGFQGEQDEPAAVPGGLPSSYGQVKGVLNDGARSLLVLESLDDGTITFVQIIPGRGGVSWKLVDRVARSLD